MPVGLIYYLEMLSLKIFEFENFLNGFRLMGLKNKVVFESEIIATNVVLRDLNELPPSYYIFNDVYLQLSRPVRYRKSEEYVKNCRINFVVIGPTGFFIIGTKDWSGNLLKDVDVAGLIFYIKTVNLFHSKLPIYNVAVMLTKISFISRSLKLLERDGFLKSNGSRSPMSYKTAFLKEEMTNSNPKSYKITFDKEKVTIQ